MITKLNKEIIQERSNIRHSGEYKILGDYVNNRTKIEMRHIKCGSIFNQRADNHLSGQRCPICYGNVKLTKEILQLKSNELYGNEYEIIGNYYNSSTKILIKHLECGNLFEQTPSNHLSNHKPCPCRFLNTEKIQEISNSIHNNEYKILGEYKYINKKIEIRHLECGSIFNQIVSNHISGRGCPTCNLPKKITKDILQKRSDDINNNEYKIIGDYVDFNTKIEIMHKKCGKSYLQKPSYHYNGSKCHNCNPKKRLNLFDVKVRISEIYNSSYKILSNNYEIKSSDIVDIFHIKCGTYFAKKLSYLLKGHGCPKCSEFKGETKISKYLESNKINYIFQKKFEDCRNINVLSFDFYLQDLNICIEYNGRQHYESVEYFGGIKNLEKQRIRDNIKMDYCISNKIKLLVIKYDEDITSILDSFFNKKRLL